MSLEPEKLKICVHCGLCLDACPTYRVLKNEADSPRGRILLMRGVTEGRIPMTETVLEHLDACLDCRACETACPAGVPYGELIEEGRAALYSQVPTFRNKRSLTRFLLIQILANPRLLKFLGHLLNFYRRSGLRRLIRFSNILKLFPKWIEQGEAMLPVIPRPYPLISISHRPVKAQVALQRGCIASVLFPQVEQAATRVLGALGCSVSIPENQTCCGALLLHGGFKKDAVKLAKRNLKAFNPDTVDFIVSTAAGCGSTLKEYQRIIPDSQPARAFAGKLQDISQIVSGFASDLKLQPFPVRVAYQDPCHLRHAQGIREEPRRMLQLIPGLKLLDLPHDDWCCGSAGIYNLTHPEMATRLLLEKIASIQSQEPHFVAVGNPGCALQIQMGLEKAGLSIPVVHPVELVARAL